MHILKAAFFSSLTPLFLITCNKLGFEFESLFAGNIIILLRGLSIIFKDRFFILFSLVVHALKGKMCQLMEAISFLFELFNYPLLLFRARFCHLGTL